MTKQSHIAIAFSAITLGFTQSAHATSCVFAGAAGPYMACLADEITDLQNEQVDLSQRVADLEATAVRNIGTEPIELSQAALAFVDPIITFTAPDGTADELDISGIVAGELRMSSGGLMALAWGSSGVDTNLYLNLGSVNPGCTLFHEDSDLARSGFYYGTDTGNNVAHIWGMPGVNTFIFAREGATTNPFDQFNDLGILCL